MPEPNGVSSPPSLDRRRPVSKPHTHGLAPAPHQVALSSQGLHALRTHGTVIGSKCPRLDRNLRDSEARSASSDAEDRLADCIKALTQAVNAVKGVVVMAPDPIREQLGNLKTPALVRTRGAYRVDRASDPTSAVKLSLRSMWLQRRARPGGPFTREGARRPHHPSHSRAKRFGVARKLQRP